MAKQTTYKYIRRSSIIHFGVVVLLALFVIGGCRRELEEEVGKEIALVPIELKWDKSGLATEGDHGINHVSIWFFPHDGSQPLTTILESPSIFKCNVRLPVGSYSILVFNEMVDSERLPNVKFRGIDKWETFEAYVGTTSVDMRSALNIEAKLPPVALAAWSLKKFVVTEDMVTVTRSRAVSRSRSGVSTPETRVSVVDDELDKLLDVTPLPLTHNVEMTIKVANLVMASTLSATVSGAVEGVLLASGEKTLLRVTHPFKMPRSGWVLDAAKPADGTAKGSVLVFGLDNENVNLFVNFILVDGTKLDPSPVFDVSDQLEEEPDGSITIEVGVSNRPNTEDPTKPPHDDMVNLPDTEDKAVDVGDWVNEDIQIK